MIYLIDRGFRIKCAPNILINQVNCSKIYNDCFCLGCCSSNVKDNNIKVNDSDTDNDSYKNSDDVNINANVNDNIYDNANDKKMIVLMILFMIKNNNVYDEAKT